MAEYLDPISDIGFKLLFGREKISEPVLIDLLNALLSNRQGFEEITSITYLNNEREPEWKDGKSIRYDILCETAFHHRFIVEMQKASQPYFIDRATFYVARGVAEQGHKGKSKNEIVWDYSLKPVIGVFICNFHVPQLECKAVTWASTMDEDSFKPIGTKTRYVFVQLPFFKKEEYECKNLEDQWIYNIKNMGIKQEVAFMNNSEAFQRLAKIANVATLSPAERWSYDADVKIVRDTINQIRGAFQEGENKGRTEAKWEHAKGMLANGIDPELTAKVTGLSINEVLSLVD